MKIDKELLAELRIPEGEKPKLSKRSTSKTKSAWLEGKGGAEKRLEELVAELADLQERLYASRDYSVLLILQAPDAAGKDGTIKHVLSGVNPQGITVTSFKAPTPDELAHDFLWRCSKVLPARGTIGVFNRSYYEEVLVPRVHPEILEGQNLPKEAGKGEKLWARRYEDINAFEEHLTRNGTRIIKLFLHVSPEEQAKRLLARLEDPDKTWKFELGDLKERSLFQEYRAAYEAMIQATSTKAAPWYVVPADDKAQMRALVAAILVGTLSTLDLTLPVTDPQRAAAYEVAAAQLRAELES